MNKFKSGIRSVGISLDDYNENLPDETTFASRANVDWTQKMLPVRNQEQCGSCWAFSTMANVEGNWSIKKSVLTKWLSTQQLVDCDTSDGGCNGGWFTTALTYLKANKPMYDSAYPYTAVKGTCKYSSSNATSVAVASYSSSSTPTALYTLLMTGPVSVAVDATTWGLYLSGIFNGPCTTSIDHAVLVVGYGNQNGVGYWIVRNSWGTTWGQKGYIWVEENVNNANSCNIGTYGYQPTF